ncbi:MAG: hypothetical protein JWN84_1582 [Nocardioides sp.]|nr:hypothetical protein [Nocardioides sp.]
MEASPDEYAAAAPPGLDRSAYAHGMEQPPSTSRRRDAALGLLAVLASVAAFLLPSLAAGVDGGATLTSALLAVAVAALLGSAHVTGVLGTRATSYGVQARRARPIVLTARATDPTHHPLRPRAPGTR